MSVKSRIEQQIIGAVLSGRTLPAEAQLLRPLDLEHPAAGIILGDVQEMRYLHPAASGAEIATELVRRKGYHWQFGVSAATLTGWCQPEITDAELAAGIRMFLRLGVDNEITDLSGAVGQSLSWNDDGYMTGIYQRDLGAAISRRWETLAFTNAPDPVRDQLLARLSHVAPLPAQLDEQRAVEEEVVLAGLLTNPCLVWTTAGIISESLFTSAYHREVYRAIDHVDRHSNTEYRDSSVVYHLMRARCAAAGGKPMWEDCPQDVAFTQGLVEIAEECGEMLTPAWTVSLARQFIVDDLRDSLTFNTADAMGPTVGLVCQGDLMAPPTTGVVEGPQLRP